MTRIRLATRSSPLALWQAEHVASLIRALEQDLGIDLVKIETTGDQIRDKPLSQIGGEGLFTKQIQLALLQNKADVAVHSMKDLPTLAVDGITLAAIPPRGPVGDALVSRTHTAFDALPRGSIIGTSSVRRRAQLLNRRLDLRFVDMRGNVETRLRKLAAENVDALVLAEAGLQRLGLARSITEILDPQWMLPAVGQGALALECRTEDDATRALLSRLDHPPTSLAVRCERAMLQALGGGCSVPIGAATHLDRTLLTIRGVVVAPDGSRRIAAEGTGIMGEPEVLGGRLAAELLDKGASELLQSPLEN
jgi:hydroxymethylbilane synthase